VPSLELKLFPRRSRFVVPYLVMTFFALYITQNIYCYVHKSSQLVPVLVVKLI
jgi:hypothetical protein